MRRSFAAIIVAASAALAVLGPAAPARASTGGKGPPQIVLSGKVDVAAEETVGDVVIFHGPVTVAGRVNGSVVAFDGSVAITGSVGGDVVAFNGGVTIGPGARVGGDVFSRRAPSIDPSAQVTGSVKHVPNRFDLTAAGFLLRLLLWIGYSISILVLGLAMRLLAPRGIEASGRALRDAKGASAGWGVALFFGLPILAVLLLVTVVAIPLGLAIGLALFLIYAVGYTAATWAFGMVVVRTDAARIGAFFAGWGILRLLALVPFVGGTLWTVATVIGLGLLTVAGRRARRAAIAPPATGPMAIPPPPAPV